MQIAAALPYPYPTVAPGPDDAYTARMLKQDHAGDVSELTAICTYLYQHHAGEPHEDEVSHALKSIAKVEMHHLDLLASAIVTLGERPVFSSYGIYWSATNIDYQTDLNKCLKQDIQGEKNAIAQYWRHIQKTRNRSVKWLLERIVRDEELHLRILENLLRN